MATMNIIQAMVQLRKDIQTWVGNNLKVKVNAELKTGSTEEYKVLSDNNFTDADKNKLDGIAEGAEVNVQSDWNVTDSNSDAFIKNKPTIPSLNGYATEAWVNSQGFKTTDNDTHYVTGITAGKSGTIDNAAIANPYIKIKDNSTHRSQIQVKGSGTVSVSSDANGVITIHSNGVEIPEVDLSSYALKSELQSHIDTSSATYAKKTEIPTTLPANGGNADTVGGFTVGINVPSNAVFTDNSTTESGHYTPTKEDTNKKQSAGSGKYISAVKLDSKKHVVGIETGSLPTFTEQYKGTVTGVKINGTTKNPSSGIVDLGTVITGSDIYVLTCTDSQFSSGWTSNATEYNAISNAKIVLLDRSSDRFCSTNIYKGEDKIILDFYNIVSIPDKGFTLTINKSGYAVIRTRRYNIYPTALSWNDGNTSGPTGTMTLNGADDITFPQIPSASSTTSGVITTAEQTFAGNKTFNGIVTGTQGFFDTSDARLKNFGEDLKVDFDTLCKIPKKYFTWIGDCDNKLQIGTSAQEIQKIYPELVNDENGILSVAYDKLSIVALSAIDELYKKNQELEMRLCKIEEMLKYGE